MCGRRETARALPVREGVAGTHLALVHRGVHGEGLLGDRRAGVGGVWHGLPHAPGHARVVHPGVWHLPLQAGVVVLLHGYPSLGPHGVQHARPGAVAAVVHARVQGHPTGPRLHHSPHAHAWAHRLLCSVYCHLWMHSHRRLLDVWRNHRMGVTWMHHRTRPVLHHPWLHHPRLLREHARLLLHHPCHLADHVGI